MPRTFFIAGCIGVGSLMASEKPRVYLTESGVTEVSAENITISKGTSAENIEVMKAFLKHCPGISITSNRDKADYIVRFDRESPSPVTPFVKGNKVAVFDKRDDLVYSESARYLTGTVKGTCAALLKHAASSERRD
jgi:hypothetical protein